jgi:hypothetical protein
MKELLLVLVARGEAEQGHLAAILQEGTEQLIQVVVAVEWEQIIGRKVQLGEEMVVLVL